MTDMTVITASGAQLPEAFTGRHLIGGAWVDSKDGATFDRASRPRMGWSSAVPPRRKAEVLAAIAAARAAFDQGDWPMLAGKERATLLNRVADLIVRAASVSR